MVSLSLAINNIEDRIRSETSESKRNGEILLHAPLYRVYTVECKRSSVCVTELQQELREKKEQLDLMKRELQTSDDVNTSISAQRHVFTFSHVE